MQQVLLLLLTALVVLMLCWHAPGLAASLVHGTPALHGGHLLSATAGALAVGETVGAVGTGALVTGTQVGRAGVSGASAIITAARLGAAEYAGPPETPSGFPTTAVGATAGVGRYLGARVTQGFRAAVRSGRIRATTMLGGNDV